MVYFEQKDFETTSDHLYLAQIAWLLRCIHKDENAPQPEFKDSLFDFDNAFKTEAEKERERFVQNEKNKARILAWILPLQKFQKKLGYKVKEGERVKS
jgi:hypothetical protein